MLTQLKLYFLLFIIYSILGWLMEVINAVFTLKRFVNRGFLIGPYCPIYGCGAILITLLLTRYKNDPFVFFIMSILLCGTLEYLTSYIMEKFFNLRWWDYSEKKFNIDGRVCIDTLLPFGLLGVLIMYVLNPFFINIINSISNEWLSILFYSIALLFTTDITISVITILTIKRTAAVISEENKEDNTEQITQKVKEILLGKPKAFAEKRLFNAYPRLRLMRIKVKRQINKTKQEINQKIDDTKEMIDDKIDKTKEELNKRIKKRK